MISVVPEDIRSLAIHNLIINDGFDVYGMIHIIDSCNTSAAASQLLMTIPCFEYIWNVTKSYDEFMLLYINEYMRDDTRSQMELMKDYGIPVSPLLYATLKDFYTIEIRMFNDVDNGIMITNSVYFESMEDLNMPEIDRCKARAPRTIWENELTSLGGWIYV